MKAYALRRAKTGFTLVELLIVVVIIGILAVISVPIVNGMTDRAKQAEGIRAIGQIKSNIEIAYQESGTAPGNIADLVTAKIISDASVYAGEYYTGYTWDPADIDTTTGKFAGEITATPRGSAPAVSIDYSTTPATVNR